MALITVCIALSSAAPARTQSTNLADTLVIDANVDLRSTPGAARVFGTLRLPPAANARDRVTLRLWSDVQDVQLSAEQPADPQFTTTHDDAEGDRTWTLTFERSVPPDARIGVRFSFVVARRAPQFSVDSRQAYAGSGEIWYPRERYDQLAVGTLRVIAADGVRVVGSGARVANTPPGESVFQVSRPSQLAFAAAPYTVEKARPDSPVSVYLLTPRPDAAALADRVDRVVEALHRLLGPLPQREFDVAEVQFTGSIAGLGSSQFFLADRTQFDLGLPLPFIGHEIAHAWWGNLVATRQGPGRMVLTEGLATFAMVHILEEIEGSDAARRFRACTYPGYTWSGCETEYFRMAAAGLELPLASAPKGGQQTMIMHRMANTKGYYALEALSNAVGPEVFMRILRRIVGEYSGRALGWTDFKQTMVGAAPLAREIFEDWFERAGAPALSEQWQIRNGLVRGQITQAVPVFRAATTAAVVANDGRPTVHSLRLIGPDTSVRWQATPGAVRVELDPDHRLLRWTPLSRARAEALRSYTLADWERRFGDREKALVLYRDGLQKLPPEDSHGARFLLESGLGRVLLDSGDLVESQRILESALSQVRREPEVLPRVYLDLARVAQKANNLELARRAGQAAIDADRLVNNATGAAVDARALLNTIK